MARSGSNAAEAFGSDPTDRLLTLSNVCSIRCGHGSGVVVVERKMGSPRSTRRRDPPPTRVLGGRSTPRRHRGRVETLDRRDRGRGDQDRRTTDAYRRTMAPDGLGRPARVAATPASPVVCGHTLGRPMLAAALLGEGPSAVDHPPGSGPAGAAATPARAWTFRSTLAAVPAGLLGLPGRRWMGRPGPGPEIPPEARS